MIKNNPCIKEEIRRLTFDTRSAQTFAAAGKIEEWVHNYLEGGPWANPGLSEGLKRQERWWTGPVEIELCVLAPAVGPEPGMEYQVDADEWHVRTRQLANTMTDPLALPPLIAEYRSGALSLRDGNTRHGAMTLLGWSRCWVIIWYNTENDYLQHRQTFPFGP